MRLDHLLLGRTEVVYFSQSTSNPSRGRVRVKLTQPYFLYSFLIKLGAPFVRGICFLKSVNSDFIWGYSSAGRAPALQAGGQRFEPAYLHQRFNRYRS